VTNCYINGLLNELQPVFCPTWHGALQMVPVEIISFIFYLSGLILLKEIMDKVKKFSRFWILWKE